jgi:glycosyltransferase involved in cell wall biosynthesis
MIEKNKADRTWTKLVDAYFCFTEFAKSKFITSGLPEEKLIVKPNFVAAPSTEVTENNSSPYLIYVGRLEDNKGIHLFMEISHQLDLPLKIVGEGPMEEQLRGLPNIELLGKRPHEEVLQLIQHAKALLFPSLCYEGMPMTILEAFAHKTPVIASNLGAMQTIISHQKNGLLFEANSTEELLSFIQLLLKNEDISHEISETAFADFEHNYSRERNYEMLMECYNTVINKN